MNRTLTAAVALAAGLGVAGLAQAQMNPSASTPPNPTMNPSTTSPGMTGGSAGTQNPATMTTPNATGAYGSTGAATSW